MGPLQESPANQCPPAIPILRRRPHLIRHQPSLPLEPWSPLPSPNRGRSRTPEAVPPRRNSQSFGLSTYRSRFQPLPECCKFRILLCFLPELSPLIFAAYFSVFDFTVSSFFTFAAPAISTALDSIAVFSSSLGTGPLSVTVPPRAITFTLWAYIERFLSSIIALRIFRARSRSP